MLLHYVSIELLIFKLCRFILILTIFLHLLIPLKIRSWISLGSKVNLSLIYLSASDTNNINSTCYMPSTPLMLFLYLKYLITSLPLTQCFLKDMVAFFSSIHPFFEYPLNDRSLSWASTVNKTFLSIVTTQRFRTFSVICNGEKTCLSYRNTIVCEFFFTEFIQPFIIANNFLWHILTDDKITNTAFITLWKDTYLRLSKYLWNILSRFLFSQVSILPHFSLYLGFCQSIT